MAKIGRAIVAVLAGAILWAVVWVGSMQAVQAAFPDAMAPGQPITNSGLLLALLAGSVLLSLVAGYVTVSVAGSRPMPALWTLASLQMILGIIAETASWSLAPVWYHLVFLGLVVPATVCGGLIRVGRRGVREAIRVTRYA